MSNVVFVTGASSGIGRALALLFAKDGDAVALAARRLNSIEDLASEIRSAGGISLPVGCDVTSHKEVTAAVRRCEAELGPVDCLIANAGIGGNTPPENFDATVAERVIQTNLLGVIYCIEQVLPGMITRKKGQIVGISSLAAFRGLPNSAAYCASKAALNTLLESLRVGLHKYNVSVTTICPGFVKTPMTAGSKNPRPFLMELDDAAREIYQAIRKRKRVYRFPWQLSMIMRGAQVLPDALYDRGVGLQIKKTAE